MKSTNKKKSKEGNQKNKHFLKIKINNIEKPLLKLKEMKMRKRK